MKSIKKKINQTSFFWSSKNSLLLQIIVVLIPPLILLKSGNLLLAGVLLGALLAWAGLKLQYLDWTDVGLRRPLKSIVNLLTRVAK